MAAAQFALRRSPLRLFPCATAGRPTTLGSPLPVVARGGCTPDRRARREHEPLSPRSLFVPPHCLDPSQHSPGRAEYILWARVSQGAPGLVMLSSTCSYISAVTP